MKLRDALRKSGENTGKLAVKFEGKVWWYDPYGLDASKEKGVMTEFRCNMGTFRELLLWQLPCFLPKGGRDSGSFAAWYSSKWPHDIVKRNNEAIHEYQLDQIRNMAKCEDYEPLTEDDFNLDGVK